MSLVLLYISLLFFSLSYVFCLSVYSMLYVVAALWRNK